ncbi:flagellar protein FlaG [Pseudoalteromonas distincta]|jgi:flagellar protein FlaG|uniref:flagellar protein FlaG n=1 Tax=Pseudoalteromonas distincta TaxID=77608 RepID=UPI0011975BEB|nr:flagellar protein FlaG [Pseudoalteromonas elyakovii]TVU76171.1 flagellar protein FlaG [Pseudoalteromonas elyakovii]|tara:strand:+ start:986 stop:1378 length:393 start_codon:yes stop_codon:yes gene_type:complete
MSTNNIDSIHTTTKLNIDTNINERDKSILGNVDNQKEDRLVTIEEPQELAQNLLEIIERVGSISTLRSKTFEFSVHEDSRKSFVVVTDSETNEIIRQIPSEEVLELASKIDKLQEEIFGSSLGILFDQKI